MHIELLWIIPAVSFAIFIFLVIYFAQIKSAPTQLKQEVNKFNNGFNNQTYELKNPDNRLEKLERSITVVTDSITNQQKVIDRFKRENKNYNCEINELKDKLRELYKEYDIILSENYSLRAKMKKMMEKSSRENNLFDIPHVSVPSYNVEESENLKATKINLKLYEDTRLLNITTLNDFNETEKSGS